MYVLIFFNLYEDDREMSILKWLAHAKIIKKSVILFWLPNKTILCKDTAIQRPAVVLD